MKRAFPSTKLDDISIPGIRRALEETRTTLHKAGRSLDPEVFFRPPAAGQWSGAEHTLHLITSVNAVAKGLSYSKWLVRLRYGKARTSRSFPEIVSLYQDALTRGGKASGRFTPSPSEAPEDTDAATTQRDKLLARWDRACGRIDDNLGSWTEPALDRLRFPHPLLGKLTVREMLLFTYYHNLHHALRIQEIRT